MMTPERKEENTDSIERLTDVIYSAGMDEESEELREIYNELLAALEETEQQVKAAKARSSAYYTELLLTKDQNEKLLANKAELAEAQQTIARQREALEFLADDSNWSWWNVGTEDETVTWVGGTDPQHEAREALGEGANQP